MTAGACEISHWDDIARLGSNQSANGEIARVPGARRRANLARRHAFREG